LNTPITLSARLVRDWLLKNGYPREEVRYNKGGNPDFILHDRKVKAKRPMNGVLYFTRKQWDTLGDDVEVAVVDEDDPKNVDLVPLSKVKRAYYDSKFLQIRGKKIVVKVEPKEHSVLTIKCSPEVANALKKFMAVRGHTSYEDALADLLTREGFLGEGAIPVF
jgi:hypothetical protein